MTDQMNLIEKAIARQALVRAREKTYTYDEMLEIVEMILADRLEQEQAEEEAKDHRRAYRELYAKKPPRPKSARMRILETLYISGEQMDREELVRETGIKRETLTPRLSELSKGGYVTKEFGYDGKVALTEKGATYVEKISGK